MAHRAVPYSWEGRRVVVSILENGGYTPNHVPLPVNAPEQTGMLEQVTDIGIVASLENAPPSTFYPWSAVLSLRVVD